jgi:hypothetical protein
MVSRVRHRTTCSIRPVGEYTWYRVFALERGPITLLRKFVE